ncbi:MAG: efflux RND transporter periplasmic adaptor subunit [Limisphaerales bacterium]
MRPASNTPTLFQIANDLTKMQIDASVAEADVGGVEEGQSVSFTVDAYPYRNFHGAVVQVRNARQRSIMSSLMIASSA